MKMALNRTVSHLNFTFWSAKTLLTPTEGDNLPGVLPGTNFFRACHRIRYDNNNNSNR